MVNEIQVGGYNGLLHKLLSMREGAPSPTLAPEVVPALVLESDRIEWQFLKGEHPAVGAGIPTAVADELSYWSIANPLESGALVVLEEMLFSATAGLPMEMQVQQALPLGGATLSKAHRDTRAITGGASAGLVAITSQGSSAVSLITSANLTITIPASNTFRMVVPLVLGPGYRFVVEPTVANFGFRITCMWRERILDPAETR